MPERIRGPGGDLLSITESGAAAVAFLRKTGDIAWQKGDRSAIAEREAAVREYLRTAAQPEARWTRSQRPNPGEGRYTEEEMTCAQDRVRKAAGTLRIPHAAFSAATTRTRIGKARVCHLTRFPREVK